MNDYPNMSYCMFGNTKLAMEQLLSAMHDCADINELELRRDEYRAFQELAMLCDAFLSKAEQLMETEYCEE